MVGESNPGGPLLEKAIQGGPVLEKAIQEGPFWRKQSGEGPFWRKKNVVCKNTKTIHWMFCTLACCH